MLYMLQYLQLKIHTPWQHVIQNSKCGTIHSFQQTDFYRAAIIRKSSTQPYFWENKQYNLEIMCISNENGFMKQFATTINDQHTEFVFQPFANKWFLLITQYGKLPNLYSVKFDIKRNEGIPAAIQGPIDHPKFHMSVPISVTCNFGADTDEVRGGIQYLVNKSTLNRCPTEFVIGLGLKEINGLTLKEVAKVLNEIIQ